MEQFCPLGGPSPASLFVSLGPLFGSRPRARSLYHLYLDFLHRDLLYTTNTTQYAPPLTPGKLCTWYPRTNNQPSPEMALLEPAPPLRPRTRVLVIDNYDSFVYNLVQYLGELGAEPVVVRNDQLTVNQALEVGPDLIIISPGPGRPGDAGISLELIGQVVVHKVPLLGVCLGHQCIGQFFGSKIVRATQVMHGKTSQISHDGSGIFTGLPNPVTATRYHSLVIDPDTIGNDLLVTSSTGDGTIMGVRHKDLPIEGVQFHPESVFTQSGHSMIENFLNSR